MEHIAAKEDKIVIKQLASAPSTEGLKKFTGGGSRSERVKFLEYKSQYKIRWPIFVSLNPCYTITALQGDLI